jgi:hypothetical protein
MSRGFGFTLLALALTFAVAAWLNSQPHVDVQTIEANAGR